MDTCFKGIFMNIQWDMSKHTMGYVKTKHPFDQLLCSEYTDVQSMQIKLTNISSIGILFKVWFIQDSGLFRVWFRQVTVS